MSGDDETCHVEERYSGSMYKTAAMPAEQSRASTGSGKKVLVPLSRYEQALFRRDMSQHCVRLSSCCGWSHEAADIPAHSSECDECACQVGGGVRSYNRTVSR